VAEQDGYVQVATDGSGKKIDNAELDREASLATGSYVAGATVYRQRVVVSDDENPRLQAKVDGEVGDASLSVREPTLGDIHYELSRIREMLELLVGN
jgi:hypothetical protein